MLIYLIIKIQNKKYLTIPLLFILVLTLCALINYPSYRSIKERKWRYVNLPDVFSEISKKYIPNNKSIVLNDKYKTKLRNEYHNLWVIYDGDEAKKKIVSILSYVLETELPKSDENIDTMLLFDRINKNVSDTISALKLKYENNRKLK